MNKEEMKEYIPKDTPYCDGCRWWKLIEHVKLHKNPPDSSFIKCEFADGCRYECWTDEFNSCQYEIVRCEYLDFTDENVDTLLWDKLKECEVR